MDGTNIVNEITRIKNKVSESYSEAAAKGVTMPTNQNIDSLPATIKAIPSGGTNINGIIKEYRVASGDNINAGNFVKFINNKYDTQLSTNNYSGSVISAVKLDNNRVFIAHTYDSPDGSLYAMIVTINGTTITKGTDTQLSTNNYSGDTISTILLDNNKVFIAHSYDSYRYLNAIVCTINGTTITTGIDTTLGYDNYSGSVISAVKLDNNRVFIAHSYDRYRYLSAMIVTINGTTITKDTNIQLSTIINSGNIMSVIPLDNNRVFIAHGYDSSNWLYAMVCTIEENIITAGTDTRLNYTNFSGEIISAVKLDSNRVFIAHNYTTNDSSLYAIVCTINGTTITKGADTQLSTDIYSGQIISAILLDNNKVFIVHSYDSTYKLYAMVVMINGTTITVGIGEEQLGLYGNYEDAIISISAILLDNNKVFIAHNDIDFRLYAMLIELDLIKRVKNIQDKICGVAKTGGTGGQMVEVITPNYI